MGSALLLAREGGAIFLITSASPRPPRIAITPSHGVVNVAGQRPRLAAAASSVRRDIALVLRKASASPAGPIQHSRPIRRHKQVASTRFVLIEARRFAFEFLPLTWLRNSRAARCRQALIGLAHR